MCVWATLDEASWWWQEKDPKREVSTTPDWLAAIGARWRMDQERGRIKKKMASLTPRERSKYVISETGSSQGRAEKIRLLQLSRAIAENLSKGSRGMVHINPVCEEGNVLISSVFFLQRSSSFQHFDGEWSRRLRDRDSRVGGEPPE